MDDRFTGRLTLLTELARTLGPLRPLSRRERLVLRVRAVLWSWRYR